MNKTAALICTTYNCKDELDVALRTFTSEDNLRLVDEVVIVDGGSRDGTWELLNEWMQKVAKLKVYQVPGANISQGRNEAVKRANADIIVSFDSGTKYKDNWLRLMLEPFNSQGAAVVGGSTEAYGNTRFQKCLAALYNNRSKADTFNPSHRGIAYLKEVWEKVGRYPGNAEAGEDTAFNTQWRNMGYKYVNVKEAKNYWLTRAKWSEGFKMARRNTRGHMSLGEPTGTWVILTITSLYLFCVLCLIGGLYRPVLWYLGMIFYAFYLMKRLFGRGRWRVTAQPINFIIGWYALLSLDLGTALGALEGLVIFLWRRLFGERIKNGG